MSTEELIDRCRRKDAHAWDIFIRQYQGLIRKAVYYRLNNAIRNDVDDIVQEVFLALWNGDKLSRLRDTSRLKGWLVVVTINLTLSYGRIPYKRQKVTKSIYERLSDDKPATFEDIITSDKPDPARSAEMTETISRTEEGIGVLNTKEKTALELNVYDGETKKQIARIMNIPTGTASSLIHRAKIKVLEAVME